MILFRARSGSTLADLNVRVMSVNPESSLSVGRSVIVYSEGSEMRQPLKLPGVVVAMVLRYARRFMS